MLTETTIRGMTLTMGEIRNPPTFMMIPISPTVARKTVGNMQFVRRTQRRRPKDKDLAIVHYRWVELNNENQQVEQEDQQVQEDASNSFEDERVKGQKKTVFVQNLSYEVTRENLENFFKEVGYIVNLKFLPRNEGCSVRNAFVEFTCAEIAHKALKLNSMRIRGLFVRLELSHQTGAFLSGGGYENERVESENAQKKVDTSDISDSQEVDEGPKKTVFVHIFTFFWVNVLVHFC